MFNILKSTTKAILGVAFSPASVAADLITMGGVLTDRDEPYTVSSMRTILKNLENAVDPDELTDEQVEKLLMRLNDRKTNDEQG